MPDLHVARLDEEQLAQAYPLIRSATGVDAARWNAFGHELIAEGGGVVGVTTESACLHGVAAFRRAGCSLRHDRTLHVEIFVTCEISPAGPVRSVLRAELEAIAREQGCSTITYNMAARKRANRSSPRRVDREERGLTLETVGFVGAVTPERGRPL